MPRPIGQETLRHLTPDLELVRIPHESSFKVLSHGCPFRTVNWHFHPEYDLHLVSNTRGNRYVGDHIAPFGFGDLVLIGADLPNDVAARQASARLGQDGGAAEADLWMKIVADMTCNPVWTIREDVKAFIGAARLVTLGCGLVCLGDMTCITLIECARPDRATAERYDETVAIYVDLYLALAKAMGRLSKVRQ